ncbi:hypothetical protein CABS01_03786 [Colletotrichum abscissum]|uniref:Uncharacterized protein n=3 Tax=Colletotrichum acutatum species complex TaxID=2707335 RepID=A0A9Q0B460_9PEZI|nr:uncharacterized protein CCOS01_03608 [Colletotrichum costaricense]XP_060379027.1 uncharacterized protein CTAM01_10238 [Colletotrichum tamarilloi]XP_060391416.1 uncharacterized protein CABS01_03786 [Colletotrichum abscissum]KAI3556440.1 hypothetical protein CABS02_03300 [Colletotrichum abscissum]KAK1475509.1 hypothetical protein CABS01_03786 [Colletotrichum abscissum]KAK1491512.1 hypothetical protein CTAM01_10238 [Colletotrichum tamarilloi]KAK1534856.1 hypothetical protein CCOS01_03608 [Col
MLSADADGSIGSTSTGLNSCDRKTCTNSMQSDSGSGDGGGDYRVSWSRGPLGDQCWFLSEGLKETLARRHRSAFPEQVTENEARSSIDMRENQTLGSVIA